MVMDGVIALRKAKSYIDESLLGGGSIAGKNVQVSKIEPIVGGNRVTFTYTLDNGTQNNSYLEVMNGERGVSVVSSSIDNKGVLSFTLSNGDTIDAGTIVVNANNINLENYYTKEQVNENFVQKIGLDDLIEKKIEENFETVTNEEIENLFK